MVKKNTSGRKPGGAAEIAVVQDSADRSEAPEAATSASPSEEATPSKTKGKTKEEQTSNGSVGISDIRKAVAFTNSVGGLDNALALLQILKVAKEVQ
ncbi:MAG: hypothetical protein H7Z17_15195 [Fuerstia sp.]|nr:hypothetical protein [Fuerstiella sp.]